MPRRAHVSINYESSPPVPSTVPSTPATDTGCIDVKLHDVAVQPEAGDNVVIARTYINGGTRVQMGDASFAVDFPILEGHRFAVKIIKPGDALLSWGLPFGTCTRTIQPGHYVANGAMLDALRQRGVSALPTEPNFSEEYVRHAINKDTFRPAKQVPLAPDHEQLCFPGFSREGRGVGTRNYVLVLSTTSRSSSFSTRLTEHFQHHHNAANKRRSAEFPNVDGVVCIAHSEGGHTGAHNLEVLATTLAGFIVHPNVAAVLIVSYADDLVTGQTLSDIAKASPGVYPLHQIPHRLMTLSDDWKADLDSGRQTIRDWLPMANACKRTPQPMSSLTLALQCGGSDAFSGVSGNPAAGWAAKKLIEAGGKALLAETDELIGAEKYVLDKVRDLPTAEKFIKYLRRFEERLSWHGQSAENNPSGGNKLRGLYNITLKSLGAAKKKHADVRLDGVLDYSQRMTDMERGYYFMDSPGNDLESVAGQVAAGCNIIFFVTGNGSITNFPFVPTVKIITTSTRYELLKRDMDFNAGRFQDGMAMDKLGQELFDDMLRCCGGHYSLGEKAGHSQVVIWRDWQQTGPTDLTRFDPILHPACAPALDRHAFKEEMAKPCGQPLRRRGWRTKGGYLVGRRVGLVLPTSLCSGQVARLIAERLTREEEDKSIPPPSPSPPHAEVPAPTTTTASGAKDLTPLTDSRKRAACADGSDAKRRRAVVRTTDNTDQERESTTSSSSSPSSSSSSSSSLREGSVQRFVALPHTEGCGSGYSHHGQETVMRILMGHLVHPYVNRAVLLEHGCEMLHNDSMRTWMKTNQLQATDYGWASVQLDGGIDKASAKIRQWFQRKTQTDRPTPQSTPREQPQGVSGLALATPQKGEDGRPEGEEEEEAGVSGLKVGIMALDTLPDCVAKLFTACIRRLVLGGADVVVPHCASLLRHRILLDSLLEAQSVEASLGFGESLILKDKRTAASSSSSSAAAAASNQGPAHGAGDKQQGSSRAGQCYVMSSESKHMVENITALVATGVHCVITFSKGPIQGHPFVPVLRVTHTLKDGQSQGSADLAATGQGDELEQLLSLVCAVVSPGGKSVCEDTGNEDFQIARGALGCSV